MSGFPETITHELLVHSESGGVFSLWWDGSLRPWNREDGSWRVLAITGRWTHNGKPLAPGAVIGPDDLLHPERGGETK